MERLVFSRSKRYFIVTFCIELSGLELKKTAVCTVEMTKLFHDKKQVTKLILFFETSKHLNLFQYHSVTKLLYQDHEEGGL
jgi:hypothetical protein